MSLNLSKRGGSLSLGPPGMKYTVGSAGTRRTVGIPGTGLYYTARDALTAAFRRKKDRDPELLNAIQYERALVYAALGQHSRAREEFGRLYADDPSYEDVAERIG